MSKTVRASIGVLAAAVCLWAPGCGDDVTRPVGEIVVVYSAMAPTGETNLLWDQKTSADEPVAAGTYGARMTTEGFDSTAVFRVIAPSPSGDRAGAGQTFVARRLSPREIRISEGFAVWTGSEAYVVGETVDIHFTVPEAAEVRVVIVKL